MKVTDRLLHAWNAFRGTDTYSTSVGAGSSTPSGKAMHSRVSADTLAGTIYNRIAIDASMVSFHHVKVDDVTGNEVDVKSSLNEILSLESNIDQNSVDFIQDIVYSMFDEGVVAVVPTHTTISPAITGGYSITDMRVGQVTQWYPKHVKVRLYNQDTGRKQEIMMLKKDVALIENPLYPVVNGPNSTMKRLISKMSLLDFQDDATASGKLDLILQLPHVLKTDLQKKSAKERVKSIEAQLKDNKYGIAYLEATEKITQLNRPVVLNLSDQVEKLVQELYNQLGLTENIFNGTASEAELKIYYERTINPILERIVLEFKRKFLTKTARSQGQSIVFRRNPFKLIPASQLAEIADTFTRNAILSPNELRSVLGYAPNKQPESDQLINRNISAKNQGKTGSGVSPDDYSQNDSNNEGEE